MGEVEFAERIGETLCGYYPMELVSNRADAATLS